MGSIQGRFDMVNTKYSINHREWVANRRRLEKQGKKADQARSQAPTSLAEKYVAVLWRLLPQQNIKTSPISSNNFQRLYCPPCCSTRILQRYVNAVNTLEYKSRFKLNDVSSSTTLSAISTSIRINRPSRALMTRSPHSNSRETYASARQSPLCANYHAIYTP